MRPAVLLLLLANSAAIADTTTRYSISFQGRVSGAQTTTVANDGTRRVVFTYRDNGRGPDINETIRVAPDGSLREFRATGKSTFGAPISETFQRKGAAATWRSVSDRGETQSAGAAVYIPVDSSFEIPALTARALLKEPTHRLPGLPGGQLAIEKLTDVSLQRGGESRTVSLYSITGVDFEPFFLWLSAPDQKFFGYIYSGYFRVLEGGWEAEGDRLAQAQQGAEQAMQRELKHRLGHRLPMPILIRNVNVFDSGSGKLLGARDVYVDQGQIAAIYETGSVARDAQTVIDGAGRTLLPGLFDMHVHSGAWDSMLQIAGGVTTVRDMGNDNGVIAQLMEDFDSGTLLGPRILPAGFIEGESEFSSQGGFVVKSLVEARDAIDWYAQRGYRQIKIYNSFKPEWVEGTAKYAHERGLRVSGHIPAFMRAEEAVRAGYDEIQHINQVMLNFLVGPKDDTRTLARFYLIADNAHKLDLDSQRVRDFVALLKERGTTIDPTLATFEAMFTQQQGEPNPSFDVIASHVPVSRQRAWRSNSMDVTAQNVERYRKSYAKLLAFTRQMYDAGIRIVAGTDDVAGFTLHRELELYVKAGIPAADALRIATWNGAEVTGTLPTLGSIAAHKSADVILIDGDPTQDIAAIRKISLVMKEGEVFYPAEIYESLGVRRFVDPPPVQQPEQRKEIPIAPTGAATKHQLHR
jgi:cytosine/adenosine deaminase-related metal-dependent hydrolase